MLLLKSDGTVGRRTQQVGPGVGDLTTLPPYVDGGERAERRRGDRGGPPPQGAVSVQPSSTRAAEVWALRVAAAMLYLPPEQAP